MLKGVAKAERYRKVDEMLELVRLPGVGNRKPGQLSGGQRQRIAIARALINQPRILLLDEPLGALDLKLREQMQLELKALQRQLGITFIFVTHDQQEALSMSDRICIFNQGKIEQIAAPDTIYDAPATPFVARFVGTVNLFEGEQARRLCGDEHQMMVRPERIRLGEAGMPGWSGEIREVEYLGPFVRYRVSLGEQLEIIVNHPNEGQARLARGARVSLSWPEQAIHRLSASGSGAQP